MGQTKKKRTRNNPISPNMSSKFRSYQGGIGYRSTNTLKSEHGPPMKKTNFMKTQNSKIINDFEKKKRTEQILQ